MGCGTCKACCRTLTVAELEPVKPAGEWCRHCDTRAGEKGCRIYDTRPAQCVEYLCLWAQRPVTDNGMPDDFRPDICKVMFQPNPPAPGADEGWFTAIELVPGAAERGRVPVMIATMRKNGWPVVILAPDCRTIKRIHPEGFTPPIDRIVPIGPRTSL